MGDPFPPIGRVSKLIGIKRKGIRTSKAQYLKLGQESNCSIGSNPPNVTWP